MDSQPGIRRILLIPVQLWSIRSWTGLHFPDRVCPQAVRFPSAGTLIRRFLRSGAQVTDRAAERERRTAAALPRWRTCRPIGELATGPLA